MVVKFGGSAITDKSIKYGLKMDVLEKLTRNVRRHLDKGGKIAIVHGGGSFGHYEVKSIQDAKGLLEPQDVAQIQLSMLQLAIQVLKKLIEYKIPAILHSPHSLCDKPEISSCRLVQLLRDYHHDLVPVTHGDGIVYDNKVYIISGDDLAAALASLLSSDCLVFIIDRPGIQLSNGATIESLTDISQIEIKEENKYDVTGGLIKKIQSSLERANHYRGDIIITNQEGFARLIDGKSLKGYATFIKSEKTED